MPEQNRNSPTTADNLRSLERERLRSLVERDFERADALHATDFQLITPTGRSLTKATYFDDIESRRINYRSWEPKEIEVRLFDGVALLRYQATLEMGNAEAPDKFTCWHTDFYEHRSGQWQVVWSHATLVR